MKKRRLIALAAAAVMAASSLAGCGGSSSKETTAAPAAEKTEEKADEKADSEEKEALKTTIYYVTDVVQQSQYINIVHVPNSNAVVLKDNIDNPFISHLEAKNEKVKFQRIDADLTDTMKDEEDEDTLKAQTDALSEIFKRALGKDQLEVKVQKLKNEKISSMITLSEEMRRMQDMMKMYSMGGMDMGMGGLGGGETLVLNSSNALVQYILEHKDGENVNMFCKQLYDLAMLAHKPLAADEMTEFVARSNEIMMLLAK